MDTNIIVTEPRDRHVKEGYASTARRHSPRGRVLVCDGDPQSVRALQVVLRDAGYEVETTRTAAEALERASLRIPDAAIVELVLPDADGLELCRRLRDWTTIPVLVLSSTSEEEHVVRTLHAGADDYLTKPFGPRELLARLQASLRRDARGHNQPHVTLDDVQVNLAARVVHRDGAEIHLTPIEFKLLRALLHGQGRPISHEALLAQVWGRGYPSERHVLRVHIANLRRKLEDKRRLIRTVHGIGYRLLEDDRSVRGPATDGQAADCTPTVAARV